MIKAPELFPRKASPVMRKYGAKVREAQGVDPAIIADSLGLAVRTVHMIQRKLGLRACAQPGQKPERMQ